MLWLDENHLDF